MDFLHPVFSDIPVFLLVFVRVTAMITLMPIIGSQNFPAQLRIGLGIMLAILVVPFAHGREAVLMPSGLWAFAVLLVREVFIGIVIGYVASLIFSVVQFAGALVDTLMGFGFVELVDPFSESSTTTLGQLKVLIFTMVFLVLGGHYYMLIAITKSFEIIPLLGAHIAAGPLLQTLTHISAGLFVSAIQLAAPAFVTLIVTSLALGVVARTVPQMNVYFVGLPLTIVLGFSVTIIAFPLLAVVFEKMFNGMLENMWKLMVMMA
jgi:flagellar biosynthesis protein FliR